MSDLAKLEEMYKKESALSKKHKDRAEELKKRIEEEKGQAIMRSVKHMKLSPEEFKKFQKALENEGNVKKLIEETGGNGITNGTGTTKEE